MVASVLLPIFGLLLVASFSSAETYTCNGGPSDVEIVGTTPGEIVSPNFPSDYPANKDCTWKIKAPLGHLIRVTITNLNLDNGDTLTISDGETAFPGNTIGKYSHCMDGQLSLFSTGSNVVVQFKSNAAGADKGFKLTFKIVRKSKVKVAGKVDRTCTTMSQVSGASGYITHQEFPNSISTNQQCTWKISGTKGKNLFTSFKMFGLEDQVSGFCENHAVRHSFTGSSSVGQYLCGCTKPKNIGSSSDFGFLRLMTNKNDKPFPGFLAYWKALDPNTCTDQQSCSQMEDDRDVGFDRNGNILFEKKPVTTTPPPTTVPKKEPEPPKQFQVNCKRDEMEVVLNITKFPELQHDTATLLDTSCKATHTNATHVFIRTALDACGTTHNYSSDGRYISYQNEILIQKQSKGKSAVITRDHEAAFVFECKYHRSVVMSVVHFTPARAKVFTRTESFGNFTYEMEMFKSKKYEEVHKKYPVTVLANQRIYLQTRVIANDTDLVLLVENCKVTPSKNRNDKEFYVIIEKGCERDETLKYKHELSPVQRFNFKAFYFEVDRDATIHLHCKVRVCRRADKNSRCVKGCPYSKRRRRSEGVESEDISGTLMIGPLEISNRGQTGASSGKLSSPESRTMIVEVLIGVLGFIVMMLVVAVAVVVVKHRRRPKKLSLIVDDH